MEAKTNMQTNSEIRGYARYRLKGNWGNAILVFIIFSVITGVTAMIPFLGWAAGIVIFGPMLFGINGFYLRLIKGEPISIENIFFGFERCFGGSLIASILIAIYTFLWTLLFVIPGIIKSLSYSQVYFILNDNPDMSANQAITLSRQMMNGYKGKLLMLHLSFIGWAILCTLTFGIGYLWLTPYIHTSLAKFYEEIKNNNQIESE